MHSHIDPLHCRHNDRIERLYLPRAVNTYTSYFVDLKKNQHEQRERFSCAFFFFLFFCFTSFIILILKSYSLILVLVASNIKRELITLKLQQTLVTSSTINSLKQHVCAGRKVVLRMFQLRSTREQSIQIKIYSNKAIHFKFFFVIEMIHISSNSKGKILRKKKPCYKQIVYRGIQESSNCIDLI